MIHAYAALFSFVVALTVASIPPPPPNYVVIGSSNVDLFLPQTPAFSFPLSDNLNVHGSVKIAAGGKGLNQAKALATLSSGGATAGKRVKFVTCFDTTHPLSTTLTAAISNTDASILKPASSSPFSVSPGVGVVFTSVSGSASAVVVSGCNVLFPSLPSTLPRACSALLLQNEVPTTTNDEAMSLYPDALIIYDMGGVDLAPPSRPVTFLTMNECEADRCLKHLRTPERPLPDVKAKAVYICERTKAEHVIVTLGGEGLCLVSRGDKHGKVMKCAYKPVRVADTTGAGDCFRAALAFGILEGGNGVEEACGWAMECAGRSVEGEGACCPRPEEVMGMLRGGGGGNKFDADANFGSRLNSMKDRRDLCPPGLANDVEGWVARQGLIKGLTVVDFNFPEHISEDTDLGEVKAWLDKAGLRAGGEKRGKEEQKKMRGEERSNDAA